MDSTNFPYQGILLSSILRDMSVLGSRRMRSRRSHGFIIKLKGTTEYRSEHTTWELSEGQILFVEKGSSYSIRQITPGYSYVVNFDAPDDLSLPMHRLSLPENLDIVPAVEKMYRRWQKGNIYGALSCLYGLLEKTATATETYASPGDRQLLAPAISYIHEHLTEPELSLSCLPDLCRISDSYLRRIFKKQYGVTPSGYVARERVRLACKYLISSESESISRIASLTGFTDALYFSRVFKKQLGISPSDYRTLHRADFF